MRYVRLQKSNGSLQPGIWDAETGSFSPIVKAEHPGCDSWDVLPHQEFVDAREEGWRKVRENLSAAGQAKQEEWWAKYNSYLTSREWAERREKVRARDKVCKAQIRCNGAPIENVHHLSYKHMGAEPLWDLVGVCRACHDELHELPF